MAIDKQQEKQNKSNQLGKYQVNNNLQDFSGNYVDVNKIQNQDKISDPFKSLREASNKAKEGVKFDSEKCPLHLIPTYAIEGTAWVFGCGAEKYAPHNYVHGMAWSKMFRAAKSHMAEIEKGNFWDEEFGTPHIYHAICSLMMLAENMMLHPLKNDLTPQIYLDRKDSLDDYMKQIKAAALDTIKKFKEEKNAK